jgi:hypothetical protein
MWEMLWLGSMSRLPWHRSPKERSVEIIKTHYLGIPMTDQHALPYS